MRAYWLLTIAFAVSLQAAATAPAIACSVLRRCMRRSIGASVYPAAGVSRNRRGG